MKLSIFQLKQFLIIAYACFHSVEKTCTNAPGLVPSSSISEAENAHENVQAKVIQL